MRRNILFIHHVSSLAGAEKYMCSLIEVLDKKYKIFFICQEPGPLSEILAKQGVIVAFMPLPAWRKIRYLTANFLRIKAIINFCKFHHIDLICSNNYRVSSYAVWPAKFLRVPVVTIIQDFVSRYKLWKFNTFVSDLLVTVSNSIANPIRLYSNKKVVTIYNGIDIDALTISVPTQDVLRSEFPVLRGKRIVGMVANIVPLKRHKLFLASMQEVLQCIEDVMFVVIGDSPSPQQLSLDDLRAYAQELNMTDKVIFTGSRQDVPALMKSFDILVHPSDREAFGRVIMEAMALGVPVVATACGGPSEIIEDEQSGFLVDVGDKKNIVEKVIKLLKDDHQRVVMGKKGQEHIRRCFNLKNTVCSFNDVFGKLLDRK
jgi:glycosyltransferase involved in cell wall biosynthesis